MKTTNIIRQSLAIAIRTVREARQDRNRSDAWAIANPSAERFTVAVAGSISAYHFIRRVGGGKVEFNFIAAWNSGARYWTRDAAESTLNALRGIRPELQLEVVSKAQLRDRAEEVAMATLPGLIKARNMTLA